MSVAMRRRENFSLWAPVLCLHCTLPISIRLSVWKAKLHSYCTFLNLIQIRGKLDCIMSISDLCMQCDISKIFMVLQEGKTEAAAAPFPALISIRAKTSLVFSTTNILKFLFLERLHWFHATKKNVYIIFIATPQYIAEEKRNIHNLHLEKRHTNSASYIASWLFRFSCYVQSERNQIPSVS